MADSTEYHVIYRKCLSEFISLTGMSQASIKDKGLTVNQIIKGFMFDPQPVLSDLKVLVRPIGLEPVINYKINTPPKTLRVLGRELYEKLRMACLQFNSEAGVERSIPNTLRGDQVEVPEFNHIYKNTKRLYTKLPLKKHSKFVSKAFGFRVEIDFALL